MTKEDFKEMFRECCAIRFEERYSGMSGKDLVVKIIDYDTGETITEDWIPFHTFKED